MNLKQTGFFLNVGHISSNGEVSINGQTYAPALRASNAPANGLANGYLNPDVIPPNVNANG